MSLYLGGTCACAEDRFNQWVLTHKSWIHYHESVWSDSGTGYTVFCTSVSSSELVTAVEDGTCPPWTYYRNNTCQCGSIGHGIIQCNITSGTLTLEMCTCVTYDPLTNHSVAGRCPYSCITHFSHAYILHSFLYFLALSFLHPSTF